MGSLGGWLGVVEGVRAARCVIFVARAAGTRARCRGRRGRREAPRSSMLRPSRGPIEGWNGFVGWWWCSSSPLPAWGGAALAGRRWPWQAAAPHGVPRRGCWDVGVWGRGWREEKGRKAAGPGPAAGAAARPCVRLGWAAKAAVVKMTSYVIFQHYVLVIDIDNTIFGLI